MVLLPPIPSSDDYDKDPEASWRCVARLGLEAGLTELRPQVWEVVVVGAGVAGASLAYKLGKVSLRRRIAKHGARRQHTQDPFGPRALP